MKQLLLFTCIFLCFALRAQNYLNELVIDRTMTELGAYCRIGSVQHTKTMSHTLDSMNVTKIVVKNRLPESSQLYSTDTLYITNGEITELKRYMDCYKAKYDVEGRLLEKHLYFEPNNRIRGIQIFKYDSLNFPIYSLYVSIGESWNQNDDFRFYKGIHKERFAKPYYNFEGVLDSVAFFCSDPSASHMETYKQTSYRNGDSVVIARRIFGFESGNERTDFIVRTVHQDTVQIRYYEQGVNGFNESTRNYVNGLFVESYLKSRGFYTSASSYNSLGLPVETFGTGVTNDGCGDVITLYEYYTIHPRKKNKFRLAKME